MDAGAAVIIVFAIAVTIVPIILMVVVRRRQKRGEWSGGFTLGFRKWTLGEEDEWGNVPPASHHIGSSHHERPTTRRH
ncbi:hypothetical protein [Tsukamurella ocularis]|uniref:hypothetical protein n=1 Tax=Tsukamurella ocularis TaxID=1970234 RepID=UPI00216AAD7D|nr:hypothetical protein [Tsukamurella ocularis]MCS3781228.1 hypothetical protein [Tsukamurella ocularis]MCS3787599.1 hypothetical protein [Tsukamurella ocularis]MCS3850894.1 hypothetical protein [Tsukamurella ocularis]